MALAALVCLLVSCHGAARAEQSPAVTPKAAFLDELKRTFAEAELHTGPESDAAYEAVRKFVLQGAFLREYERDIARQFGASCAEAGVASAVDAVIDESMAVARGAAIADDERITYQLQMARLTCPRRASHDNALFADLRAALAGARLLRAQRFVDYVEAQRERARAEAQRARLAEAREAVEQREKADREAKEAAAAKAASEVAKVAESPPESAKAAAADAAFSVVGTFRCITGEQNRVMHFEPDGEFVELVHTGDTVLGFAGMYVAAQDRVVIRYAADNTWKIFALTYQQPVTDEHAWKRSAIASQKVTEFRFSATQQRGFRPISVRTKLLLSGETSTGARPECRRLEPGDPTVGALAAHARLAMRYVDKKLDLPPPALEQAKILLTNEIFLKRRKEMEWFRRAPGLLKMMATDRLLQELRNTNSPKCSLPRGAIEGNAAEAMQNINKIGESELAAKNPGRAEFEAGRQLEPVFEHFLDMASRAECVMEESSAVGL